MAAPILTTALIDRVKREQRQQLRPPSGWGYSTWPLHAGQALPTLTAEGWCASGWIECVRQPTTRTLRCQIRWQVATAEVRWSGRSRTLSGVQTRTCPIPISRAISHTRHQANAASSVRP
jgi:hypothetical protein